MINFTLVLLAALTPLGQYPEVHVITREEIQASEARVKAGIEPPPLEGELKANYDAFLVRLAALGEARRTPQSATYILSLPDLLYEDMKAPYINSRWQDAVVEDIQIFAMISRDKPEVTGVLRNGLLNYAASGGGRSSPFEEIRLARTLTVLGGPSHPECDTQAAALAEHATKWADQLGSEQYVRLAAQYQKEIDGVISRRERANSNEARTPEQIQALQRAESAVRAVALGESVSEADVEALASLWLGDFGNPTTNLDMLSRLLIAYRRVLDDPKRARLPVVKSIDKTLISLAEKPRLGMEKKHWLMWSHTSAALGRRASRNMKLCMHKLLDNEKDKELLTAFREAEAAFRGESVRPAAQPSSPSAGK